jgi:predicted DCC family thiol-disulfide oxidoreductase YuxK
VNNLGDRLLVIFDGHCGLCNRSVRWFLTRDHQDRLRFTPSDSPSIGALLRRHGLDLSATGRAGTILVALGIGQPSERVLTRSTAVLALLRELPTPWPAVAGILRLIPRPLRDLGYRLIARFRYRIWARLEACPLPTPPERARFL